MRRRSGLTLQEEILLLLYETRHMEVGIEGPYSATREGISEALGIKPNTFSHKVQPLIVSKDVIWEKAHVLGFRKRVRIYRLNSQGLVKAERIITSIKELQVTIPNEFGERQVLTIEQAMKRVRGKGGYLELLRMRKDDLAEQAFDAHTSPIVKPDLFVGRENELDFLLKWFKNDRAIILVLYGIAGIGKTSLASQFACSLTGENRLYVKVHEWDTTHSVLDAIGNKLVAIGDERLQIYLKNQSNIDMANISIILRSALSSHRILLMLDDVWKASKETMKIIPLLCDAVNGSSSKLLLISREFPVTLEGDMEARGLIKRMRVDGLSDNEARKILATKGMTDANDERLDRFLRKLQGHPLFLTMLQGTEDIDALYEGNITRFIRTEIYARLSSEEAMALGVLATLRYPIPSSILVKRFGYETIESLGRRALIQRGGDRLSVHDVMRSFVQAYVSEERRRALHLMARELLVPESTYVLERVYHAICAGALDDAAHEIFAVGERLVSLGHARDILPILADINDKDLGKEARLCLVKVKMMCNNFIGSYAKSIALYREHADEYLDDPEFVLDAADSFRETGALEELDIIFPKLEKMAMSDGLRMRFHRSIGRYYAMKGSHADWENHVNKALELARRKGENWQIGRCLISLAVVMMTREDYDRGADLLLQAMRYLRGDEYQLSMIYGNLAVAYQIKSMTELALGMIERAEEIIKRSGDMAGLASSYINKGILYMTMGRLKESKEILLQAVEISRELGHRRWLTVSLAQLAGVCNLIGEYSDGERYANESVSIAKRTGDTPGVIDARNHQGYSLICQGKKEQGIKVLKQNIKDARSLGKHQMAIEGLRALAEGYLRLRNTRNARSFAEQAIAIAKERRFAAELKTMEKVMRRIEASR